MSANGHTAPTSYFIRTGVDGRNTFAPTVHAEGAWSTDDYHFASLAGLCIHVLEQDRVARERTELQLSRVTYDILGRLPFQPVDIEVDVVRPGRTIELVQATVSASGRSVITARAWYLVAGDTADSAGGEDVSLPPPETCPERDLSEVWAGGLIAQMKARQAVEARPGRGATWLTSDNRLVAGEESIGVAEFFSRIDVANGIAARQSPEEWAFPNVDLTVHLHRLPVGDYTGLDTSVAWGPDGVGVTSSVLHDVEGPVGYVAQSLTLRRV